MDLDAVWSGGMGVLDGVAVGEGERAVLGVNLGRHIITSGDIVT